MRDGAAMNGQGVAGDNTAWSVQGLVLETAGRRLLDIPDLGIAKGRCTVMMGANGAGKTLLLRLLHGLMAPTYGGLFWNGGQLDDAARREQAMVFQKPVVLRRSVWGNLCFTLAARGVTGQDRRDRALEALALARLSALAKRPARRLSGGEQQRLAVASALACRPRALLLDEPTASLDPASTAEVERMVDQALADGITVVLVTHDAGQARRLGDDLIFLHQGAVIESGLATDVLDAPQSPGAQAWLSGRLYLPEAQK